MVGISGMQGDGTASRKAQTRTMPFHVRVRPVGERVRPSERVYGINLDESALHTRFLERYEQGLPLTGGGRSVQANKIDQVLVFETSDHVADGGLQGWITASGSGTDRTDDFVTGAPGNWRTDEVPGPGVMRDPTRVMIVHGRNVEALDALRAFLHSLGLVPILWEDAIEETEKALLTTSTR